MANKSNRKIITENDESDSDTLKTDLNKDKISNCSDSDASFNFE